MTVRQISREELDQWRKQGKDFQLIDVREKHEHHEYNIGGDLIPLSEIGRMIDKINLFIPVVFYCRKGIRSQIAIQRLQQKFPDGEFYNLTTGISTQS